jgi:hypothetical protein
VSKSTPIGKLEKFEDMGPKDRGPTQGIGILEVADIGADVSGMIVDTGSRPATARRGNTWMGGVLPKLLPKFKGSTCSSPN